MLRIESLTVDPLPALTFSVGNGECLAIEGPSGSGKTRLLRAIADLDDAPGHIFLDGAERCEMRAPEWRKRIRYASAEPAWWTDTAREVFPDKTPEAKTRLARLMSEMAIKPALIDRPLIELSTGERQRLALARALIDDPAVLLLDEPTAGLDPQSAALVEELIRYQLLAGKSVVLASHDQAQIGRLADARLQLARPLPVRRERPR